MSKIKEKYIKFGTSTGEVRDQSLPSTYTPTNYTSSAVASEGSNKVSAHLKGIDIALGLAGSAGDIIETSFSLSNNQVSASDITNFVFTNASVRSFTAYVSVEIDADTDLYEAFEIKGIQKSTDWSISTTAMGDDSQVTFSITSSGQLQYTSGNYTNFSSGLIKFRAIVTSIDDLTGGGGTDITETSFSLSNNQAAAANVTDFLFANGTIRSFNAHVSVEIDATADVYEVIEIKGIQKSTGWDISTTEAGDDSGVDFTITSSGQVQYTSDNYSGFVSGKIKFRAITTTI